MSLREIVLISDSTHEITLEGIIYNHRGYYFSLKEITTEGIISV
jgi:hypothetical protein